MENQADYRLEQVQERVTSQLDNTWEDGLRGFGGRRGTKMGFPGLGGF